MTTHRLGRTELMVSPIAWGTVEIGLDYGMASAGEQLRPDAADAERLVHAALDLGVNVIDTARAYGDAEPIIGRALGRRRAEAVLVTKVFTFAASGFGAAERRARMLQSVEESLMRLRTDAVDLLLLHCGGAEDSISPEALEVLAEVKARGLARHTGASTYGLASSRFALGENLCECLQIAASALDRRMEPYLLPAAAARDCGLMIRSVLLRGALTSRWPGLPQALSPVREAARSLEQIAGAAGMTLPELAYRYMLGQPGAPTVLCGTGRLPELQQAVRWAGAGPLAHDLRDAMRRVSVSDPAQLDLQHWPAF